MADSKHEKAVDLTEQALEKLVDGDEKTADSLIAEAKKLDKSAPAEVLKDLDEDAARPGRLTHHALAASGAATRRIYNRR